MSTTDRQDDVVGAGDARDEEREARRADAVEAGPGSAHVADEPSRAAALARGALRRGSVPIVAALVFAAFFVGLGLGRRGGGSSGGGDGHAHGGDGEEQATTWTCSMHPAVQSSEPGQCPICGMDLIPVEGGSEAGGADEAPPTRVTLTERAKALARIVTAEVERADAIDVEIRLLGRLDYDERRVRTVTSWTSGRIDQLLVAVTGQRVRRGQVIAKAYSPEIYAAQADLIQAAKQASRLEGGMDVARSAAASALEATRQRLRLLGVPDDELERMERAERPWRHVSIRAPHGGTVIERLVDEGSYVSPGTGIYKVADLSRLWVQLDAYERDLAHLARGQKVSLTVSAFPAETFEGRVAFIDPVLDRRTRTTSVRVEVGNGGGRLQPGMFAEAVVEAEGETARPLVVPETAPLFTGRRSVVYVEVPDRDRPTYEARQVRLGPKAGHVYPVIAGLSEGERVVVEGAFALDADLQIRGGASMMAGPDDSEPGEHDRVVVADERFVSALEPVLGAYLNVQERLAADDLEAARGALGALEREVGRVRRPTSGEAREAWAPIAEALAEHGRAAAGADDIDGARAAFEGLSGAVKEILVRFGNPLDTPVRLAYCPMAFDDRGADWVQRGEEIDNSYFGAVMRRCGEIRATVAPGGHLSSATGGDRAAGHGSASGQGGHVH